VVLNWTSAVTMKIISQKPVDYEPENAPPNYPA